MGRTGRYEYPFSDLRTQHLAFNLNLNLSFSKYHQFIYPLDKVGPDSSWRSLDVGFTEFDFSPTLIEFNVIILIDRLITSL